VEGGGWTSLSSYLQGIALLHAGYFLSSETAFHKEGPLSLGKDQNHKGSGMGNMNKDSSCHHARSFDTDCHMNMCIVMQFHWLLHEHVHYHAVTLTTTRIMCIVMQCADCHMSTYIVTQCTDCHMNTCIVVDGCMQKYDCNFIAVLNADDVMCRHLGAVGLHGRI